ncbi:MAG: hypothetical protein IJB97_07370, partial [Clostridia bacterium]|nr:hypothetical protein [Clostridia bacterium]
SEYAVSTSIYNDETQKAETLDGSLLTWTSSDENVVTVSDGVLTAVGNGSTTVTGAYDGETVEVAVNVFTPVYSAEDLDTLALCTYKETAEKAQEILSANYMLMNDIDYSTHVRNFILPIASPNAEDGANFASVLASSGGDYSYYSKVWQDMFDLEERTTEGGGAMLYEKDGKPFMGINPNGIEFSGIFDGNGYAVKNAWLMVENVLFMCYHESTNQYNVGNMCFIGVNSGIVRNLAFEDILIGSNVTFLRTDENGNRYYEYNQNPVHYWMSQERIEAHKKEDPIWAVYAGKAYESATGDVRYFLNWPQWGSRFAAGNAFILHNKGSVENVYARYRNVSNVALGMLSGGITLINDGSVADCVLELDLLQYAAQGGMDMEPMHPIAVANYGTVKNVNVITAKTAVLINNDSGNTASANTYVELNSFLNDGNALNGYSVLKWSFTNVVSMVKNLHGF